MKSNTIATLQEADAGSIFLDDLPRIGNDETINSAADSDNFTD
ncbi:hypothetical protein [Dyadobacter sp. CY345]|nr:hypothetical protein [Dyadobacter sp. CY345]